MKQKINKMLGKEFKKQYNVKLKSLVKKESNISMLIEYNGIGAMFKINTNDNFKDSIEAIKSIIINEVEFK